MSEPTSNLEKYGPIIGVISAIVTAIAAIYPWINDKVNDKADKSERVERAVKVEKSEIQAPKIPSTEKSSPEIKKSPPLINSPQPQPQITIQDNKNYYLNNTTTLNTNIDSDAEIKKTALMMLSDIVPPYEAHRRSDIARKISEKNATVKSRLHSIEALKALVNAGISPESVSSAVNFIQKPIISSVDGKIPEAQVAAIDQLIKPVRGNRREARSANDEGLRMMKIENFPEAIHYFNQALIHDTADVEVVGNLSYAYLKNGQLEDSILVSEYAVRISPRRAGAWNQIAVAQSQRGADWLAVRAYMVLYALSGDQFKTKDFLIRTSTQDSDERTRNAAQLALHILPEPAPR